MLFGCVLPVAAAFAAASCGTRVELEAEPIEEADFAAAYAQAYCSAAPCCETMELEPDADCVDVVQAEMAIDMARAREVGAVFDPEAAGVCVEALRADAESCAAGKVAGRTTALCEWIYTDKPLAEGEPCEGPWDCADDGDKVGACYNQEGGAFCLLEQWGEQGDACGGGGAIYCAPPLRCEDESWTCEPPFELGERCVTVWGGDTCVGGAVCDVEGSGLCEEARPPGAECDDESQCEDSACNEGRCEWTGLFPRRKACLVPE